ncbi:S8 family peptidase [Mucilaginibacter sp. RS28]|uniref:S8 family peptidase n=1 Tax=Mucilaginibacter straminoryzae TaxID=2932774 RepID=A0A9X2B8A3_9SPHI|nr:S8 family peptidase [Mucilaginibacter straminoryzae]MCJ8209414.1 S8 family peptidase [Mucilaginibacter straminoryzae]
MNITPSLKKVIGLCLPLLFSISAIAQPVRPKANWQNLDLQADGMFGISTEKAYNELLKDKKPVPVIVAVLDGGVDINHEDLKNVIWVNTKEIAGNGIDDDHNGYADDVNGWNFLGSKKGNVEFDNLEITRILKKDWYKYAYADTTKLSKDELAKYHQQQKLSRELNDKLEDARKNLDLYTKVKTVYERVFKKIGKQEPTLEDFADFIPDNPMEAQVKMVTMRELPKAKNFKEFYAQSIIDPIKFCNEEINYHLNLDYDSRDIVGDDYNNSNEHYYGNPTVNGPTTTHGTHVAGIIGASRDNGIGVKGVANNVQIMSVNCVPNGDERDKDIANAIRYAVDNGAKVINMSFGRPYCTDKAVVDEAIKYAMSKDVLLVHAAGNDNEDLDKKANYPTPFYNDGGHADAWLTVGASGFRDDQTLKADFSNYGKQTVDVFAPGIKINSTVPGSAYVEYGGTSMASPVVAGLAALIRSYYPKLTAVQVKEIIIASVVKVNHNVDIERKGKIKHIAFADLCRTGGIVNAYQALKLAESRAN